MKVWIADDAPLIRNSLVSYMEGVGHTVVKVFDNALQLRELGLALAQENSFHDVVDLIIADVAMPPTNTDDGLDALIAIREAVPDLPVVALSQYKSSLYAERLVSTQLNHPGSGGTGYLLKERTGDVKDFLECLDIVAAGGTVIDPDVDSEITRTADKVMELSERETLVLKLMSQGLSNEEISDRLGISLGGVSKHVGNIFQRLNLGSTGGTRRIQAVLAYLAYSGHLV